MDELNARVRQDIEQHGWHVGKIAGDDYAPAWAFTIGLAERYQHAEVIAFGLELEVMHTLLNRIGSLVRGGRSFAPSAGEPIREPDVLQGLECSFRPVATRWREVFAGNIGWYYRERSWELVQCFWPDPESRFPWEPGFDSGLAAHQPKLYEPDEAHALAPGLAKVLRDEGTL